ncbi:MAG: hypothetical protein IPL79_19975 [Myxococcales bacterium]|nr:hypothetical protein [Myxococcales bacterium]
MSRRAPPPPTTYGTCLVMAHFNDLCPHTNCRHAIGDGTCSLKYADAGAMRLEEVGEVLGVTRERVRQLQLRAERNMLKLINLKGWE